ncbi:MAG: hypothetical protein J7J98_09635 [candidate division Zixibacteria bacterium]|nr:hypothetical protein [candidate division Zixibacteria bacterium]
MNRNAGQVKGRIDYILNGFESKLFAARKKKSQHLCDFRSDGFQRYIASTGFSVRV